MSLQDSDLVKINRDGIDYKSTAGDVMSLLDTDFLAVNRGGVDYKVTAGEFKEFLESVDGGDGGEEPDSPSALEPVRFIDNKNGFVEWQEDEKWSTRCSDQGNNGWDANSGLKQYEFKNIPRGTWLVLPWEGFSGGKYMTLKIGNTQIAKWSYSYDPSFGPGRTNSVPFSMPSLVQGQIIVSANYSRTSGNMSGTVVSKLLQGPEGVYVEFVDSGKGNPGDGWEDVVEWAKAGHPTGSVLLWADEQSQQHGNGNDGGDIFIQAGPNEFKSYKNQGQTVSLAGDVGLQEWRAIYPECSPGLIAEGYKWAGFAECTNYLFEK